MFGVFTTQYYGDVTRWFVGVVEQVGGDVPPLGRVRVRIHGIHGPASELPLADLPYAQVLLPTTEGGASGIGRSTGLIPGATVFGIFLDGTNSQLPLVLGSIPKVEVPSSSQLSAVRPTLPYNSQGNYTSNSPVSMSEAIRGIPQTYDPSSSEQQNIQIAWDYFMSTGNYTKEQVAGMIGNFMVESRMNPAADNPADKGQRSIGIAQWRWYGSSGGRQTDLFNFANQAGKPWEDLYVQLAFVDYELAKFSYLGGAKLKSAPTVEQATLVFMRLYERPEEKNEIGPDGIRKRSGQDDRLNYAKSIYENYANNGGAQ
jgi:hypothetical protein